MRYAASHNIACNTDTLMLPNPPLKPSPKLRLVAALASCVWWLLVSAVFFTMCIWALLHWSIVPRIGDFRPRMEILASKAMGVPVQIGEVTAQSGGLLPSFMLKNVKLLDPQNRPALVLNQVVAVVSPLSVWRLGFEQLVIEQPELDVRRSKEGKIFVAGLDFSASGEGDGSAADWFFSQAEFAVKGGTVRWTDELTDAAPLSLTRVDLVVRNPRRRHFVRLDATPPPLWGERFKVTGLFSQAILGGRAGRWEDWDGSVFADFPQVDISQLKRYALTQVQINSGAGALRAWAQVSQGQITQITADVSLPQVNLKLAPHLEPLSLLGVHGRLSGQLAAGGLNFASEGLEFRTSDGLIWPKGNVSLVQTGAEGKLAAQGEFAADQLDLAVLSQIADRLPLGTQTHGILKKLNPKGQVKDLKAKWLGHISAGLPSRYDVAGRVEAMSLAAAYGEVAVAVVNSVPKSSVTSHPGFTGMDAQFKLNQSGGEAKLAINGGQIELPGAFEEPLIPIDKFSTDMRWTLAGQKIDLSLSSLKIANADAQIEGQAKWHTSDPQKSHSKSRFPGVLDLSGTVTRFEGKRVWRYLPAFVAKPARDYIREAILEGAASEGTFKVKGDIFDMPFNDPKLGDFKITAKLKNAHYAYAPKAIIATNSLPWPALIQINGDLVFQRTSLTISGASARVQGYAGLQIPRLEVRIPDLGKNPIVLATAEARGPVSDLLGLVSSSPLSEITSKVLQKATATGQGDYKLRLNLPIGALEKSKVLGTVALVNSDIQITPDSPVLTRTKGLVTFSESGFSVRDTQARMYGGDMRLEGGSRPVSANPELAMNETTVAFRALGTLTAEGLRAAKDLGFVSRIAKYARGGASYAATLGFRRGIPELSVSSNLQGVELLLPAPLNKAADVALPLRYENTLIRESFAAGQKTQDQLVLELGRLVQIQYIRDVSVDQPTVIRGGVGVGLNAGEAAPAPEAGVVANINFAQIDMDAWQKVLGDAAIGAPTTVVAGQGLQAPADAQQHQSMVLGYVPSTMAVRAQELTLQGRVLHNVVVGGSREGQTWRANLDARELNGYVEYRESTGSGAGRVYARLARLSIAPSTALDIETTLSEQPSAIPALDIVVEDFELKGKKLGRVEVEAVNLNERFANRESSAMEWRLNKLNVVTPEAQLNANGSWALIGGGASIGAQTAARTSQQRRRTQMNFRLDINDAGEFLKRFGQDKVVAKGKGKLEGQVGWLGSPLALDYPTMAGNFNVNVENGQFLKADPGLAKLLGVLSLQSLPRRLALDFRDVFTEGFSFDFLRGDVRIEQGVAITNNLQMKGVNAAVLMDGKADIAKETQDIKVVVVPEINAGTASLIATVINPAIGLGTFLAQYFLRRPLMQAATQEFHIDGSWAEPRVTKVPYKPAAASGDVFPAKSDTNIQ